MASITNCVASSMSSFEGRHKGRRLPLKARGVRSSPEEKCELREWMKAASGDALVMLSSDFICIPEHSSLRKGNEETKRLGPLAPSQDWACRARQRMRRREVLRSLRNGGPLLKRVVEALPRPAAWLFNGPPEENPKDSLSASSQARRSR